MGFYCATFFFCIALTQDVTYFRWLSKKGKEDREEFEGEKGSQLGRMNQIILNYFGPPGIKACSERTEGRDMEDKNEWTVFVLWHT